MIARLYFFVLFCSLPFDAYSLSCDAGYEFLSGSSTDTYVVSAYLTIYKFTYAGDRYDTGTWKVVAGYDWGSSNTDGKGTIARFGTPGLVANYPGSIDSVMVHDSYYSNLRKVNVDSGLVTTFLRNIVPSIILSSAGQSEFFFIVRSYLANISLPLYNISEVYNSSRQIVPLPFSLPDGSVAPGGVAKMYYTGKPSLSPDGTFFIITDTAYHSIRRLDISSSMITTIAGSQRYTISGASESVNAGCQNGVGTNAEFNYPQSAVINSRGSLVYIVDVNNRAIRVMNLLNLSVSNVAGSCPATAVGVNGGFMSSLTVKKMVLSSDETYLFALTSIGFAKIDLSTKMVYYVYENPASGLPGLPTTWFNFAQMPRLLDRCSACAATKFSVSGASCITCPAGCFCNSSASISCPTGILSVYLYIIFLF